MSGDLAVYLLGAAFLVACLLTGPFLRRKIHDRALRGLGMTGVSVIPRFWTLSGLRLERPKWKGEVSFEPGRLGGGRPGHLRLAAEFRVPVPVLPPQSPPPAETPLRTGDAAFDGKISVQGDPAFARKLLVPEMRERLLALDALGGRVLSIGEGALEIAGPLVEQPPELRRFLELCDAIVDATVAASGA